jgi:hypothetical protein
MTKHNPFQTEQKAKSICNGHQQKKLSCLYSYFKSTVDVIHSFKAIHIRSKIYILNLFADNYSTFLYEFS